MNMAIDIKSLRIGSHILVNGKRERVRGLDEANGLIIRFPAEYVLASEVEPIAITPELLKELGFEDDKTGIAKHVGGYFIFFHQISYLRWRVSLEGENCMNYGNTLCRYLHEAEALLALHGVELIPD